MRSGGVAAPLESEGRSFFCKHSLGWPRRAKPGVKRAMCAALVFFVMGITSGEEGGSEPHPSKILVIGNPPNIRVVASWLENDPMVDPRQVPCRTFLTTLSGKDIQRYIRLYFPRNYDDLVEYEYIMLIMVEVFFLTNAQQKMIYNAIAKDGLGALQDRSVMSMAEWIAHPWADSIISDAFPNDADKVVSQKFSYERVGLRYVVNTNPSIPPIFKPYKDFEGVETAITPGTTCICIPKEGAVVTSYIVGPFPEGYAGAYPDPRFRGSGWMPHTMYWRYGNATTWTHTDMLGGDLYWNPAHNPYSLDMLMAEFMFATGRDLPSDVVLVHNLRSKFASFISTRGFIYAIIDFVNKFGANDAPIVSKVSDVTSLAEQGKKLYLKQEYEKAAETMDLALSRMEQVRQDAMRLKDRALFWVYLTEWLVVTGVFLLAGFAVWTLMIQRKLYREVEVTRAGVF